MLQLIRGIGLCSLLLLSPLAAYAQQPEYPEGELLVKFRDSVSRKSALDVHKALRATVIDHIEFIGVDYVRILSAKSVQSVIGEYKAVPEVEYAEPNYYRYLMSLPANPVFPSDPLFSEQWGLHNTGQTIEGVAGTVDADIDAPEAWRFPVSGDEVVVAVIDSGVGWFHPDLGSVIWENPDEIWDDGIDNDGNGFIDDTYGWDFIEGDNLPLDYYLEVLDCLLY